MKLFGNNISLKKKGSGFVLSINKADQSHIDRMHHLNISQIINADSAVWGKLNNKSLLEAVYNSIAPVNAIINLKCEAHANMNYKMKNLKNGELYTSGDKATGIPAVDKSFALLENPNPLQGKSEFLKLSKAYHQVFGNGYVFGLTPSGFAEADAVRWNSIENLKIVPSQYTKPIGTGAYFFETELSKIIQTYLFEAQRRKIEFSPNAILHLNEINISFDNDQNIYEGQSKLVPLNKEITNIAMSIESRNVIGKKRGALGIFSSALKNDGDVLPLQPNDKQIAQNELDNYGTLEDQEKWVVTTQPLQFQRIILSSKELGLFEEESVSNIKICNSFGVPEILMKLYVTGATFENQEASVRRMYNETIIPESKDWVKGFNQLLKLEDEGLELIGDFSHVAALQENQKEAAEKTQKLTLSGEKLFKGGAITYNKWLEMSGIEPTSEAYGNKRITELTTEEILVVTGKIVARIETTTE